MANEDREYGDGSVFPDKEGGWVAMLELPRKGDGKRRRGFRRRKTEAAAEKALKEMRNELDRSGQITSADRTVINAIETFRATLPDSPNDNWLFGLIEAGLGSYRVKTLSVAQCDQFLSECAAGQYGRRPIGKNHVGRVRQRLAGILRNEMRLGSIERNVAEVAKMPTTDVTAKDQRALSVEELHQLLDRAEGYVLILVDLCGRNALRPAEARALRRVDFDLDTGELDINGQMNRRNERGPVKRATNAERTIGIDDATISRLRRWRDDRRTLGPVNPFDFVGISPAGKPIGRELFANDMKLLCAAASVAPRITPYELRHTAISHQADTGRTAWEIADWAGTSEAMISSRYRYRHRLRRVSTIRPADT